MPRIVFAMPLALAVPLLAGCAPANTGSAFSASTPGATGRTIVPGNTSTIAGDAQATELQQKWGVGGRQR